jgi:hypothetical protein
MKVIITEKYQKVVLAFAGLVVLAGLGLTGFTIVKSQQPAKTDSPAQVAPQPTTTVKYTAIKGETVLAQLKKQAEVVTKDSTYGAFVDSINGLKGGTDGKYWTYYIDGKMADKGADAYVAIGGEVVEWKFEK